MPLADVVYGLDMARILNLIRATLINHGFICNVPCCGNIVKFNEVSYVDDCAFPVCSESSNIVTKAASVVSVVYNVFAMFGLKINLLPGKTEVVIGFNGPGSIVDRKTLFVNHNRIQFNSLGTQLSVRCVDNYKHLGTRISFKSNSDVDVVTKAAVARNNAKIICNCYFKKSTSYVNKLTSIKAHLLSKGNYICSTWAPVSTLAHRKYHHSLINTYRLAFGHSYFDNHSKSLSDQQLIDEFNLITPITLVACSRLQLVARIYLKHADYLINILKCLPASSTGWYSCLKHDFVWLTF